MRALIIAALLALLGAPAWAEEAGCMTKDRVIGYFMGSRPGMLHQVYTGADSEAIKDGLMRTATRKLEGAREFVVFSHPDIDDKLIVGFKDGCYEAQQQVSPKQLDDWLAGSEG